MTWNVEERVTYRITFVKIVLSLTGATSTKARQVSHGKPVYVVSKDDDQVPAKILPEVNETEAVRRIK